MNAREKKLATAFGLVAVVLLLGRFVFPSVKSLFDYGTKLTDARNELDEVNQEYDDFEATLTKKYAQYVERTGSTVPSIVKDEVRRRVLVELNDAGLTSSNVVAHEPKTSKRRGPNISTIRVTIAASGAFVNCMEFIKGMHQIPYLARFTSLKLTPQKVRQRPDLDQVKLNAELDILVLPALKALGVPQGDPPLTWDRLALMDTRALERWRPFSSYRKPTPKPAAPTPTPPSKTEVVKATLTPNLGPPVDPYASAKAVRGILRYGVDEVLLQNERTDETEYIAVGKTFDAGKLVLVHPLGAVAHKVTDKEDFGYFVYPLGKKLSERVKLEDAREWLEIQFAMQQYFDERRQARDAAIAETLQAIGSFDGVETGGMETGNLGTKSQRLDFASRFNPVLIQPDDFVGPPPPSPSPSPSIPVKAAEDSPQPRGLEGVQSGDVGDRSDDASTGKNEQSEPRTDPASVGRNIRPKKRRPATFRRSRTPMKGKNHDGA